MVSPMFEAGYNKAAEKYELQIDILEKKLDWMERNTVAKSRLASAREVIDELWDFVETLARKEIVKDRKPLPAFIWNDWIETARETLKECDEIASWLSDDQEGGE